MIKPYYDHAGITIYHGDCREILPHLEPVDLVLTDPPYPNYNMEHGKYWEQTEINWDRLNLSIPQLIFWPADRPFPYSYTAIHIWHKPNGQSNLHYECIYERNGKRVYRVYRVPIINYETLPEWQPHPTQKPIKLIIQLIRKEHQKVLDPFMGSGTTLVAAKQLGRKAVGIEIEERYCEIAVKRLQQECLDLSIESSQEAGQFPEKSSPSSGDRNHIEQLSLIDGEHRTGL